MDVERFLFETVVIVGKVKVPMNVYVGLRIGDILLLDQRVGKPFKVEIEQEVQFHACLGLNETRKAIKIDERIHIQRDRRDC